ncbi:MAG: HEAT repeat domain-containing protein [Rubripirellula sp.]
MKPNASHLPNLLLLLTSTMGMLTASIVERARAGDAEAKPQLATYKLVLRDAGVPANAAGAIELIKRYKARNTPAAEIKNLISQLGSKQFHKRTQAQIQLLSIGDAPKKQLEESTNSLDLEILLQSQLILNSINSKSDREVRETYLLAAFQVLAAMPHDDAVATILSIFPELQSKRLHKHASLALWFAVSSDDVMRLKHALKNPIDAIRIAAIPAWEIVHGEKSLQELRPLLAAPSPAVRLSAARALFDYLPQQCMEVLLDLLNANEQSIKLQAAWLIAKAMGDTTVLKSKYSFNEQAARWKQRFTRDRSSNTTYVLGSVRFTLDKYVAGFLEEFNIATESIKSNYRKMKYVTTVDGATASVRDGIARFDGRHNEGDQRLLVSAAQVVDQETFTEAFTVVAKIGGEQAGAGGYHVGVSIGNLRMLFHPGYTGGGFRVQRVDDQQYLVTNQTMPFTPIGGNLYTMNIEVSASANNKVRLKTTIIDHESPNKRFTNLYQANRDDIGKIETVGVERSGRLGGAALIGFLAIDTSGIHPPSLSANPNSK